MKSSAEVLKALADEVRLKMVWLMLHQRELCVCDFMEVLDIPQSRASRHLRTLYHAGLVSDRRPGTWSYYRLRDDLSAHARAHLDALRAGLAPLAEAAHLLTALERWQKRKARGEACNS